MSKVKFIDLFAGIGGLRLGFEKAFNSIGVETECVFTSEIKPHAIKVLEENFTHKNFFGDITKVENSEVPEFDFLLAGFPCQAFSSAGKRLGFADTRGTLFFEVERILKDKKPKGFILENVEGLLKHDPYPKGLVSPIGRTLDTMLNSLKGLGYNVDWKILNAKDFGVPQSRKRIFIVGSLEYKIDLSEFDRKNAKVKEILEQGLPNKSSKFTELLFKHFKPEELYGKSIKDKRGGKENIHSWDIGLKGEVSLEQRDLLEALLKERRKKHWAKVKGIAWMDGMPLTFDEINSFYSHVDLEYMLKDLVEKGYLKFEFPKDLFDVMHEDGSISSQRKSRVDLEKGYNIVTGKLSFEFGKILDPEGIAPTIVATDVSKIGVIDGQGIRQLTVREGARLFGFPDSYKFPLENVNLIYDLLGNTVVVPVAEAVAGKLAAQYFKNDNIDVGKENFIEHRSFSQVL